MRITSFYIRASLDKSNKLKKSHVVLWWSGTSLEHTTEKRRVIASSVEIKVNHNNNNNNKVEFTQNNTNRNALARGLFPFASACFLQILFGKNVFT